MNEHFDFDINSISSQFCTVIKIKSKDNLPYRLEISLPDKYPLGQPKMKLVLINDNFNSVLKTDKFFGVSDFLNKTWNPSMKLVDVISK